MPVNFAVEKLKMGSEGPSEIELAGVTKTETFLISDLVAKLAYAEGPATEESSKRKWLYLHMAWLFENRADDGSTWDKVDNLFADFGYPESIAHVVSFMPGQTGSRDKTDRRGEAWIAFLKAELQHFESSLREIQR